MPWGLWAWKRLIQTSGLPSVWFPFLAPHTLFAILKYSLPHIGPPKPLVVHLQSSLLPKVPMLVMHLSQNIYYFVTWYHQPTFKRQERAFTVKIYITLLVKVPVTCQGRIALLSDVIVNQPCRTRWKGHQGRKRSRIVREGIRDKMVLFFGENNGDTQAEVGQESSPAKLLSTQVGLWKKITQEACGQYKLQSLPQQGNPSNNANS